jgi:hypothetical protein
MNPNNQRRKQLSQPTQPNKPWYATDDSIDLFALIMDKIGDIPTISVDTAVNISTIIWKIARQYDNLTGEDQTGMNQIVYSKKSNFKNVSRPQLNDKMKKNNFDLTKENFTRINNDTNGNPRYVTSFLNLLSDYENYNLGLSIDGKYNLALRKAKSLGGKKFNNKLYGGGIVFGSVFNLDDLVAKVQQIANS